MEEVSELSSQKKSDHSFPERSSKPDKSKKKDTGDQRETRRIQTSGGGDNNSSNSNEEDSNSRKSQHSKACRKINIPIGDNL